eukprot:CAMPEP_0185793294 /NCGR_PEP_ID=MMETSP1174-20130828/159394_1 /TAXON_ID=35687 /ORGANISM="Dictyocha speculum, Strain CCMP1381" /LENGTH=262 /DNA_ID=CAMNT_0028488425 /DNA_START=105 /DNA_END=893 /DNA_ORIENTATION=-
MDDLTFRPIRESDIARLLELDASMSVDLAREGSLPLLPSHDETWWEAHCLPERSSYRHWGSIAAELPGFATPAGYIVFHSKTNRKRRRQRGGNFVEIFWLAVAPWARRRGIASALLLEVRHHPFPAHVAAEHRLHVMTTNLSAISLYQRMGFTSIATKKDYPIIEYTALRMAWVRSSEFVVDVQASAPTVRNFWRTLAFARPSTGGKDAATAKRMSEEWEAQHNALGYVNGQSYGHWKDGRIRGSWVRVDPKTKKPLSDTEF